MLGRKSSFIAGLALIQKASKDLYHSRAPHAKSYPRVHTHMMSRYYNMHSCPGQGEVHAACPELSNLLYYIRHSQSPRLYLIEGVLWPGEHKLLADFVAHR